MAELDDHAACGCHPDSLVERATKEQLVDVAPLLALNFGR
jgi:hypothetical protein